MDDLINKLATSGLYSFKDWPNSLIPRVCSGVYSIYDREEAFLYVGMAGADLTDQNKDRLSKIKGRKSGLFDRLNSHASGYRSGDRFNIYICDLFVLTTLTSDQIREISMKKLSLDALNKDYIRNNLSYRYIEIRAEEVRNLERTIQRVGINGVLPIINPKLNQSLRGEDYD